MSVILNDKDPARVVGNTCAMNLSRHLQGDANIFSQETQETHLANLEGMLNSIIKVDLMSRLSFVNIILLLL